MHGQAIVYETLDRLGIVCEGMDHEAAYTVEDMERLPFPSDVVIAKNLFLRDAKGRRHFLVTAATDRKIDVRALQEVLASTRLSFGSTERLARYLGVEQGSVSPLCILNDVEASVEVFFDPALRRCGRVGVHPNDNRATLFLAFADLEKVVREHGNPLGYLPER